MSEAIWQPSEEQIQSSHMKRYMTWVNQKFNQNFVEYEQLHDWSVEHLNDFWSSLFEFCSVKYSGDLSLPEKHDWLNYQWFPKCRLNFAQNLLARGDDKAVALNFRHESGMHKKISYGELKSETAKLANFFKKSISASDVVAAFMPNIPETVVAMLATSALGGTFTSTSCDFGVEGVVDRFGQSKPKILVTAAGYTYNGKYYDLSEKVNTLATRLESVEQIVVVDFLDKGHSIKNAINWKDLDESHELTFVEVPFSHPQYIMYSSGTTGAPKCIVHSIGGSLLQHIKELQLHSNIDEKSKVFFFTTCGWMMWNWLVAGLYFGSEVFLYEGSPAYPDLNAFMDYVDQAQVDIWGTSPKFLRALENSGYEGQQKFDKLQVVMSTGAPIVPEQYDFVMDKIKHVQLASISGGTDIIGCFMLGNPMLPVTRGEIQCLALGMDVTCFDQDGQEEIENEGELVCLQSFPSQPTGFLNDPNHARFKAAYFEHFPGVWHHGDFITITLDKTVVVHGRSDATLNPGGVRIGTAEIYAQTEQLDFVEDTVVIGKKRDGDVDVVLFVQMSTGHKLTEQYKDQIKVAIQKGTTPRHVPREIFEVSGIPYTRSGKKMELAVSRIVNGKRLTNIEAVANPETLEQYETFQ